MARGNIHPDLQRDLSHRKRKPGEFKQYLDWTVQRHIIQDKYHAPLEVEGVVLYPITDAVKLTRYESANWIKHDIRRAMPVQEYNVLLIAPNGLRFARMQRSKTDNNPLWFVDVESMIAVYGARVVVQVESEGSTQ